MTGPRVALIHDFLLDLRGAERVFAAMCDAWPEADVFTAVYDERGTEGRFADRTIHTSFLQRVRPTSRTFRPLLPFYPHAVESFDLRGYDTVISSSSAWAHGVLVDPGAVHVCYCHNPFRYAWTEREATLQARNCVVRPVLRAVLSQWRQWDWIAAQRVDRYVANSQTTAERGCAATSGATRPCCTRRWRSTALRRAVGEHYVVLAELMAHKRIDVAVQAFSRLGLPLVVIGDGPEGAPLAAHRGADRELQRPRLRRARRRAAGRRAGARGHRVRGVRDRGGRSAQAAGRPVIALGEGGVRESVREGETGAFYERNEPDALAETVLRFDALAVDPAACRASADRFSVQRFQARLSAIVDEATADERPPRPDERSKLQAGLLNGARRATRAHRMESRT